MLDTAPEKKANDLLEKLGDALACGDIATTVGLFQDHCYWRDLVSFTWNIRTMEDQEQVRDMLESQLSAIKPANWQLAEGEGVTEADEVVDAWITFETAVARGAGHVRIKDGRIWTLLTTMSELKGYEEPQDKDRPMGVKHGAIVDRKTWKEERDAEAAELGFTRQPYCVIVGGGQGGIALGARLRQLGVPTIIIERNECPGGQLAQALQVAVLA